MTSRPLPRQGTDDGVSSVLGAVLVFGLLVITLVTVQVNFVPVWQEDREARHMDAVVDQLRLLKADLDRQANNATAGQVSAPLTLSTSGGFRFFQSAGTGGDAQFNPSASGSGATLASPRLRLIQRGGVELYALNEVWTAIPVSGTGVVTDLTRVDHLRIRVTDPNQETHGDSATLTVRDANNNYAGKAIVTYLRSSSERSVQTEIFSAASTTSPITLQRESYFHQVDPPYIYSNLLDDELLFGQVLSAAAKPMKFEFVQNDLNADYTVAYTAASGGTVGSGGVVVNSFTETTSSGRMVYTSNNQFFPAQDFILEHGGIVLDQPDGSAVVVPPSFALARSGAQAVLDWTLPALDGDASGLGGARAATVVARPTSQAEFEGVAAQLTVVLPTEYGDAWEAFFENLFAAAGFSTDATLPPPTNPEAVVQQIANGVQITVYGPVSNPGDTITEDVVLHYRHAIIDLDLRPSG